MSIEVNDYCSYNDVVEGVDELGREALRILEENPGSNRLRAVSLLLRFAGVTLLTVDECSPGCEDLRDVLLLDAVENLGKPCIVDTCILYNGFHTQLYEASNPHRYFEIPLCLYLELYEHVAQIESNPYKELRAEIAKLVIDELENLRLRIDENAAYKPCEVGIALSRKSDRLCITSDRNAYEKLFKTVKVGGILAKPSTIKETRFLKYEASRRASYAYYAVAQLRALVNRLGRSLRKLGIEIRFETT